MKIENQVVSLELAKKLKELGVPRNKHNLAELGEMLPVHIQPEKHSLPFKLRIEKDIRDVDQDEWNIFYVRYSKTILSDKDYQERGRVFEINLANAMAKMLIYLLENGLLDQS